MLLTKPCVALAALVAFTGAAEARAGLGDGPHVNTTLSKLNMVNLEKNLTAADVVRGGENGLCSYIAGDLPQECQCQDGQQGQFQIDCTVDFLDVDTIGFAAAVAPCAQPAEAQFRITESDAGIDWQKTYSAGDTQEFAVPGLTVGIPLVGSAQVELAVGIQGNAQQLQMQLGLDACATVLGYQKCGSDLTSELPYWVLSGSYDFSGYCTR